MLDKCIDFWLQEDLGPGDYSSRAAISAAQKGTAKLLVKEDGILAGVSIAKRILEKTDPTAELTLFFQDGDAIKVGDIAFTIHGNAQNLLSTERLILNCMQRMSGIATKTRRLVDRVSHTKVRILDTRKTTPGFRLLEKEAVKIGGGENHRFGLFDRIMLKDNHIDFCGSIKKAMDKVLLFQSEQGLTLPIEVEVRNFQELKEAIAIPEIDRIMLDNFSPEQIVESLKWIPVQVEVEASGGIDENNLVAYAETGVHFISMGTLTHHVESLDLSLKAVIHPCL
jgi:nicotinate-nucleotide pyrophosphorylase (carboxylating)